METHVISVSTLEDKEDVAQTFSKYNFIALPVVDKEDRLVGIITVDDAIDVMEEETTEDIEKMAAMLPTDKPYLKTSVWETYKSRIPSSASSGRRSAWRSSAAPRLPQRISSSSCSSTR